MSLKTRSEEIEQLLYCHYDFIDVIEELYPDEFEIAYEEYKKRLTN